MIFVVVYIVYHFQPQIKVPKVSYECLQLLSFQNHNRGGEVNQPFCDLLLLSYFANFPADLKSKLLPEIHLFFGRKYMLLNSPFLYSSALISIHFLER